MEENKAVWLNHADLMEVIKRTPLVSIDLIVKNEQNKVLLGMRKNEPARGFWFVPGGRIMLNERISDALERIARNEVGTEASFRDARFLGVYEHIYRENFALKEGVGTHYVVLAYEIKMSGPVSTFPDDQHQIHRWVTVEDLLKDDRIHPNTKAYFLPPATPTDP
jgi:colanic acid biosynthesis protein WcaH